jgi:hypothetical protein
MFTVFTSLSVLLCLWIIFKSNLYSLFIHRVATPEQAYRGALLYKLLFYIKQSMIYSNRIGFKKVGSSNISSDHVETDRTAILPVLSIVLLLVASTSCMLVQNAKHREVTDSTYLHYDSQVPAMADKKNVDGVMYYKIYQLDEGVALDKPVRSCYLQHGYGIDQTLVDFKRITFDNFVHSYYGMNAINKLLKTTCGEVVIAIQETNMTTILEMTMRTEKFLRDVVCKESDQLKGNYSKTCAYIGHSKGGAVAFNIARRCMETTSLLGAEGCKKLQEIYSSTGVIQGAMATFAVYGAYLSKEGKNNSDDSFVNLLGFGINLVMPIYDKYEQGKTNPTYIDLSPVAPMEEGKPLYLINDIALEKKGWLIADFAASGVKFSFSGKTEEQLFGCSEEKLDQNSSFCKSFGKRLGVVHSDKLKPAFLNGLNEAKKNPMFSYAGSSKYLDAIHWDRYQTGDGLADYFLSINACQKGLSLKKNASVKSCVTLPPMNHLATAGGNVFALEDIIKQLTE